MENELDLQAVPIAPRAPPPGFSRLGTMGIVGDSVENLNSSSKIFPTATPVPPPRASLNIDQSGSKSCCPQCTGDYEQELMAEEFDKSSSETKPEAAKPMLPPWLQNATAHNSNVEDESQAKDQEMLWKKKSHELHKKWADTCLHRHPHLHQNLASDRISRTTKTPILGLHDSKCIGSQVHKSIGETLKLKLNQLEVATPSQSPVTTDLALGRTQMAESTPSHEDAHKERVKGLLGCISSQPPTGIHEPQSQKMFSTSDADSFKKLLKGLIQKVWWQREAASAVAATVSRSKSGNGKCRGGGSKGDVWLMFTGPDRVGKRRMATVLSELVCGTNPVMLRPGSRRDGEEFDAGFRGKTMLDRIAEAVRRNPNSVIVFEDVHEADTIVRGSIKRAMERGRITDSYGREVSLGNVIFILTATNDPSPDEEKLAQSAGGGGSWQLRLSACQKTAKRRAHWLGGEDRRTKQKKELASALSFDLNLAADAAEEDGMDGSGNSSDLTVDHEDERGGPSLPDQLISSVDDAVAFKPVNFGPIRHEISSSVTSKFSAVFGEGLSIEVEDDALEKILGGVWLGETGLEEWAEKVLVPSFRRLKEQLPSSAEASNVVVRLEPGDCSGSRSCGDRLPDEIDVAVDDGLGF